MAELFDTAEETSQTGTAKPIWTLKLDPKEPGYKPDEILNWLRTELTAIREANRPRFDQIRRNMELFKGIQYFSQERRDSIEEGPAKKQKDITKIVANHIQDLVQNHVSRLVKFKPAVSVIPTNDEFEDKQAAKGNQMLIDHIWYQNNYEDHVERTVARYAKIMGECYLTILFDDDKGELHPDYKKARDAAKKAGTELKIPLVGEDGEQVKNDKGEPQWIEKEVKQGDVAYGIRTPFQLLLQQRRRIEEVQYCFILEELPKELAKLKYPHLANSLDKTTSTKVYDFERMEEVISNTDVEVWHFYHLKLPLACPDGLHITFTTEGLAGPPEPYPYTHQNQAVGQVALPFERFTDIEVPEELHARSFIEFISGLTGTYNNVTNLIVRNQILVSHPKWMMPYGAAQRIDLGNDASIVEFKGAIAPQLVQASPSPGELFTFREQLREEFTSLAGLSTVSRGEPPPGITAGIALQFLSEQENERMNESFLKFAAFRRFVALKSLSEAADNYQPGDRRMLRVLGKNNAAVSLAFETKWLSTPYDIRVQNASALSQSKPARVQTLLDLHEKFPDQVTGDQVLDMLDMAQSDKFISRATVAVRAAEAENELLLDGKDIPEPEEYEDLPTKWEIRVRAIQEYSFKSLPEHIQENFKDNLLAIEMLIFEKARLNPLFQQAIMANPRMVLFPVLFRDEMQVPPPEIPPGTAPEGTGTVPQDSGAMLQGQAGGEPPLAGYEEAGLPIRQPGELNNPPPPPQEPGLPNPEPDK